MTKQLTFSLVGPLANLSASQALEKDYRTPEATSCSPILQWLTDLSPNGLSGKMSPVSCHLTQDEILEPSSGRWGKSGTGFHGESWTLNTSEFHKDADVCSLSDVLEIGEVPQVFYLSQKACQGILRRAEKRGKELPQQLAQALLSVAQETPE
jgi:hypothetical protein